MIKADRRGSAVIPAAVAQAHGQAAQVLARAQQEAQTLRDQARAEGLEAGRAQAAAVLAAAAQQRGEALCDAQGDVIELALQLAERLLAQQLDRDPAAIVPIAKPLLDRMRTANAATVTVHPEDLPALERWLAGAQRQGPDLALVADASLRRGDCVVSSGRTRVDGRIEVKLDALRRALGGRDQ